MNMKRVERENKTLLASPENIHCRNCNKWYLPTPNDEGLCSDCFINNIDGMS